MNKKLNLWLNVTESILVTILVIIGSFFYITEAHFNLFGNIFTVIGSMLLVAVTVSIELFLLYLLNNKYKLIVLGYYFIGALLVMLSNAIIPFFGIILIIAFSIFKNIYRIQKSDIVYEKEQLYDLCDMFNIKIKKERKKRASVSKTKKTVKTTATKKRTVPAKKTSKSYA